MSDLLGEYECTMDAKGRIKIPTALLKQLSAADANRFVISRGFENCLNLYPYTQWQIVDARLKSISQFSIKNRKVIRFLTSGATVVTIDVSERVRIPQILVDHAGIKKDVVITTFQDRFEVWDKVNHESTIKNMNPDDISQDAEDVLGAM